MKRAKLIGIILCVAMLVGLFGGLTVSADAPISVTLDGEQIEFDVPPQMIDNHVMVPLRAIFEALSAQVDWDADTWTVTATRNGTVIVMQIGNATITVAGYEVELEIAPVIVNSRTLVPTFAVAESFGITVVWNEDTQTVILTTDADELDPADEPETDEPDADEPDADEPEVDDPEAPAAQTLVGTWNFLGLPFYVFEADGRGLMSSGTDLELDIRWTAHNGVLSICITPDICGITCIAPAEYYYTIEGNQLTLTSTLIPELTFTYTRG